MPHRRFKKSQPINSISLLPDLGMTVKDIEADIKRYYGHRLGRDESCKSVHYVYEALSLVISDRLTERWKKTYNAYKQQDCKKAYYLSMEFLMGRTLSNAMLNLGVHDAVSQAVYDLGLDLEELVILMKMDIHESVGWTLTIYLQFLLIRRFQVIKMVQ
jgi:starch phosphorylase